MSAHCDDCGADLVYTDDYPMMECERCKLRVALAASEAREATLRKGLDDAEVWAVGLAESSSDAATAADAALAREATLKEALEEIANGPWPEGFIADAQRVARAALSGEGLSQDAAAGTLRSNSDQEDGDEGTGSQGQERGVPGSDEAERGEAPVSELHEEGGNEPGGRRVEPLDRVPVVRMAHGAAGDVGDLLSGEGQATG